MFCKNCGKESDSSKKFCSTCGTAFFSQNERREKNFFKETYLKIISFFKKIKAKNIIWIVIVLIIIGYNIYSSRDQSAIDTNNNAVSNLDAGNNTQAIAQFQDATLNATSNDTKISTLKNLAYTYDADGQEDLAISSFQQALKLTTKNSLDYYLISGEIASLQNNPSSAYLNFTKAYKINPDDYQVNNSLAIFYMDLQSQHPEFENYKSALIYAQKAYSESNLEIAKQNLGMAYYFNEDYTQAISTFSSITLEKDKITAYWLGLSYARNDDVANAKLYLQKAVDNGVEVPQEVYDYLNSH